jgi:hypothetical protein
MTEFQSPQSDSGQQRDAAAPFQATQQTQPDLQTQDVPPQYGQPSYDQQLGGQSQYQAVQAYVPQQAGPGTRRPYATGLTSAQQVWYTLHCIYFGMGYLAKIPAKKALEDYGMLQLNSTEQFWYTLECVFFGAGYFAKLPTAKALSEMPQFKTAALRTAPVVS